MASPVRPASPAQPLRSGVHGGAGPVPEARVRRTISERQAFSVNGVAGLLVVLALLGLGAGLSVTEHVITGASALVVGIVLATGFTVVAPGDTKVVQFLGTYVGTIRHEGPRLTYPLTVRRRVSVKVRNFETRELKVNDATGNPVNIAAIIVWQVSDTAQSVFAVERYEQFVMVQSEAALRHIATIHPYDNGAPGEATLRGSTDQVAGELAAEVSERVAIAGITIIETRISTLAFAPEIAQAMLQRQQAEALLAARSRIVEGAVTMVESALARLEEDGVVELDEERKAAMVSNLLVVLCSDSRATPVVNTGTLYT